MKKNLLSILLLALPMLASAYDIAVDNAEGVTIFYNLVPKAKMAEVTYGKFENSYSGSVNIPQTIKYNGEEYLVNSIGDYAFYKSKNLIDVTIPNSIEKIGLNSFRQCNSLNEIHIPNSVKEIGEDAFLECKTLQKVIIDDIASWCSISFYSWFSNPLRTAHNLYIGDDIVSDLVIPNTVTRINEMAFYYCTSLKKVSIAHSVKSIGSLAFSGCSNLISVDISNTVSSIEEGAFQGTGLLEFTIPNSVTTISNSLFGGCLNLKSIYIPSSVKTIQYAAFSGCLSLTSVIIPSSVTNIEWSVFANCTSLTSIEIPNSVTSIEGSSFYGCTSLVNVKLPNKISNISLQLFEGCKSIEKIIIPSSVTKIGEAAFKGCTGLKEVYCYAEQIPSTDADVFKDALIEYSTLHVPLNSVNLYKITYPWSEFGSIKSIEGSEIPETPFCGTPSISYANKQLTFSCETEGVEYHYSITDTDIKSAVANSIDLTATYEISVYATKSGYEDSDVATATLVWTDAIFTVTTPETPTSAKAIAESIPVLISANGGVITVKSEQEGQAVAVYTADGKALGSATVKDGQATVATNIQRGEIVIVKVGGRSVKMKM